MPTLPTIGKISPDVFSALIYPQLGSPRPEVLVGPQSGVDVAIVDLGHGQVLATTCDPVFVVPQYGFARAAWFAVHILASDAAMSGLAPAYMAIDLNLPLTIGEAELTELWAGIHDTCAALGIAIVSGHTARYEGCNYPMVGGATVFAVGAADRYLTPAMAQPGDILVCTKGAAIEATALFVATFPDAWRAKIGEELSGQAAALFEQMSVVEDARVAVAYGVRDDGVTCLHDATEGGVVGGVFEIAQAAGVGVRFAEQAVPIRPEVAAVCATVGIDPLCAISEGTLLATVRPQHRDGLLAAWRAAGIEASAIGEIVPAEEGMVRLTDHGERPLVHPQVDPFWAVYGHALEVGL
ncbi:MAG: AIR synthase family protein [Thermoleophilia bacterium]